MPVTHPSVRAEGPLELGVATPSDVHPPSAGATLFCDSTNSYRPSVMVSTGVVAEVAATPTFPGINDARSLTDGATQNASKTFSSASAAFTAADVGKVILIIGAGTAGADLATTIASVTSATQVQLTAAAGATLSGVTWAFGTNNTSRLTAALTAISGTGKPLVAPPGTYIFGSIIDCSLFHDLTLSGYGATFIVAAPGSPSDFLYGASVTGSALALSADVAANQRTLQITTGAPLSVGQTIRLNAGELASTYKVVAVAGSSPQTVTVDRVIQFTYKLSAGAQVNVVTSQVTNFDIVGLTFTGSCSQYIKIRDATNSTLRDCNFLATVGFASDTAFNFAFAVNWQADNVYINGPKGLAFVSCEQCWLTRYTFVGTPNLPNTPNQAVQILNSANCGVQDFSINTCGLSGIVIDQLAMAAGVPYTVGIKVSNGFIGGCSAYGITDNGFYTTIDNVDIVGNASGGILHSPAAESPKVSRCRVLNNGSVGISNNAGIATGAATTITDCVIGNNTADVGSSASGIVSQGPLLYVLGCQIVGLTGSNSKFGIQWSDQGFTFGCTVVIDNCDILVPGTSLGAAIVQQTGDPLSYIRNTRIRFNGGASFVGSGINNLNGRMVLDNVQAVQLAGTSGATGIGTSAGTLTRINQSCDFSGCTTPVSMGGFCNRSFNGSANANSVTLNGTTPVNYGFTDTKSTDRVQLILRTRGGTPGNGAVLVAITPGTGVSLAGNAASVNDVYDLVIG